MAPPVHDFYPRATYPLPQSDLYVVQSCKLPPYPANPAIASYIASSMKDSPASHLEREARDLFRIAVPNLVIRRIKSITAARAQLLWRIETTDGSLFKLAVPSRPISQLLNAEKPSLTAEACLLKWLSCLPPHKEQYRAGPYQDHEVVNVNEHSNFLQGFLPSLLKHGAADYTLRRREYLLTRPTSGVSLALMNCTLTPNETGYIRYQVGRMIRRISCHVSPNGQFGPLSNVLLGHRNMNKANKSANGGFNTWTEAFNAMINSVTADLEAKGVMVNCLGLRQEFRRMKHLLDRVKRPTLVGIEAGEDQNLLFVTNDELYLEAPPDGRLVKKTLHNVMGDFLEEGTYDTAVSISNANEIEKRQTYPPPAKAEASGLIQVTGLQDWSHFIFGDPLIAVVFTRKLTPGFMRGLAEPVSEDDPFVSKDPIEDRQHMIARVALYECYHALVAVAREFYHKESRHYSGDDDTNTEFLGRRRFARVLAFLRDRIDDAGNVKPMETSADDDTGSPPKKIKVIHE